MTSYTYCKSSFNPFELEYINVVSVDPGIKSMCIMIEKRCMDTESDNPPDVLFLKIWNIGEMKEDISVLISRLTKMLDDNIAILKTCNIFLVERQMMGKKMIRVCQHILTYFTMFARTLVHPYVVVELDSRLRLKGKPRKINSKVWSVDKVIQLLNDRHDMETLKIVERQKAKQKSDMCDAILQSEMYFRI